MSEATCRKKVCFMSELKVHGVPMQNVSEDKYLGDILSCDAKNTKNVHDRFSKGNGIISKIFSIIDTLCFGPYLFEIAVLLRNSMLINGVLNNAEIWYNLLPSKIKLLESLDKIFFSRLFHVPGTTLAVSFYLELGVLPIML